MGVLRRMRMLWRRLILSDFAERKVYNVDSVSGENHWH